jgi:hypothetical protein
VGYNALANTGAGSRTGTISVGTATFTVTQPASAASPSPAHYGCSRRRDGHDPAPPISTVASGLIFDSTSWLSPPGRTKSAAAKSVTSYREHVAHTAHGNTLSARRCSSNQIAPNCATSLSTNFVSMPNTGGPGRINITSTCSWTAATDANWIRFTSVTSGSANGYVTYIVAQNLDPQPRSTSITIGDQVVIVRQDGTPQSTTCTYSISPASSSAAGGGSGTIVVTVDDGCTWSATTATSWIAITSAAAGSGNGEIAYTAAANTGASQRRGAIVIAGKTFSLDQDGTACTYSIAPRSASFPSSGGSGTIDVASPCAWNASSNRNWMAITGGAAGTGN